MYGMSAAPMAFGTAVRVLSSDTTRRVSVWRGTVITSPDG